MPQLNPAPWLSILLITWTTMMLIFLNKTLNSKYPKMPTLKEQETNTTPWNWPWP